MTQIGNTAPVNEVLEGTTPYLSAILRDRNGPIPRVSVIEMFLTLYDKPTGQIINTKDRLDVLDDNGGTLHPTSGLFGFQFTRDDMAILDPTHITETRVALLEWTYSGGELEGKARIVITVRNLAAVGAS